MVRLMGIFRLFRSIAGRPQRGRSSEGPGNGRSAGITCASATSSSPATSSGSCERGDNVQMIQVALKVSCGEWTNRSNGSSQELANRVFLRLANDRRSGRLRDSEIIIDFKILVGVIL